MRMKEEERKREDLTKIRMTEGGNKGREGKIEKKKQRREEKGRLKKENSN